MKNWLLLFLVGSVVSASAATKLYGVRSNGMLFRFDPISGAAIDVGSTGLGTPNALAISPRGILYAANFATPRKFARIDMATGAATDIVSSGFADIRDMVFFTGILYGIRDGGAGNDTLVTIDPATGAVSVVGTMGATNFQALGTDEQTLYAWSNSLGLHTVNPATGLATDVDAGVGGPSIQGLAFTRDGLLIGADSAGGAYLIDVDAGTTSPLPGHGDVRGLATAPRSYRIFLRENVGQPVPNPSFVLDTGTMELTTVFSDAGPSASGTGREDSDLLITSGVSLLSVDAGIGLGANIGLTNLSLRGLAWDGSQLFAVSSAAFRPIYVVDPNTAVATIRGNSGLTALEGLADVGGTLYGWDHVAGLVTINKTTGAATDVNPAIGGTSAINALEVTPDGHLLGFGDKLYSISRTDGSFIARGGNWPNLIGSACVVTEDADFIAVTANGIGLRVLDRTGNTSALGWNLGTSNFRGLEFGDDGHTYTLRDPGANVFRIDPSTGVTNAFAPVPVNPRGLGWYEGDLVLNHIVGFGQFSTFDPITNSFVPWFSAPYGNAADFTTTNSGRFLQGEPSLGLFRIDPATASFFDLGGPVFATPGIEMLPDETFYGAGTNVWHVIDPLTGTATTFGRSPAFRGIAYVGQRINGSLFLGDYAGDPRTQIVTVEYRHRGTTRPVEVRKVRLGAGGSFTVATFQKGGYDMTVKGSPWLRRKISPSSVTNGVSVNFGTLVNGDVDGDNEIAIGDYAGLSTAFGSEPGNPHWNPNADLNGDDAVDIGDFAILSNNFGETGDD